MPVPLALLVKINQLALLTAVQPQPGVVVTVTVAGPPLLPIAALVGDTATLHAAPPWVTVTVCPATVRVPLRDVVVVLAAVV
jgi:hypothetical protein